MASGNVDAAERQRQARRLVLPACIASPTQHGSQSLRASLKRIWARGVLDSAVCPGEVTTPAGHHALPHSSFEAVRLDALRPQTAAQAVHPTTHPAKGMSGTCSDTLARVGGAL